MNRLLLALLAAALLVSVTGGAAGTSVANAVASTEVVVLLAGPPLVLAGDGRSARVRLLKEQRAFEQRLSRTIPQASVRWRYRLVANGLAIVVPRSAVPLLRGLPGVREVVTSVRYRPRLGTRFILKRVPFRTTELEEHELQQAAPGATGAGLKIAIIDDGVDQDHPFFSPRGYEMPPGFPKGQRAFTTAKVIVARAFPPPGATWKHADLPFDPELSSHATHVAGIAAGNANTQADVGNGEPRSLSGMAPGAYIGNYKALSIPTDAGVGLDGNSPEILAAIEAAVADGMDVINLSIGEPEIEPSRDIVALALDAAAAAGVVPVVAAGNDFIEYGRGSVTSPGTSAGAITVAAVHDDNVLAGFSSAGPTPLSLRLKPDVSAPGVSIMSSEPGGWTTLSGTSMAAPYVAGVAALLRQQHPGWTVEQVKSALTVTAGPVWLSSKRTTEAPPPRGGAGVVSVAQVGAPLVHASPVSVSFELLRRSAAASRTIRLTDAGGGAGIWRIAVRTAGGPAGVSVVAPTEITVPGEFTVEAAATADAGEGELSGFLVLTRQGVERRIPFWLRAAAPALGGHSPTILRQPGTHRGNTSGRPALVDAYRYPDVPETGVVNGSLRGPEQVFRVVLHRAVANFGVVVTHRGRGVAIEPRVVAAGDENRLTSYAGLPINLNPYLIDFQDRVLAAGAIRPAAGVYDVVFDSPTTAGAGAYRFRFWLNDTTPPSVRLRARRVAPEAGIVVRVSDSGAGVDPGSIVAWIDGDERSTRLRGEAIVVSTAGLDAGRHRLRLQVSDYQETRNMENVPTILPNTRVVEATFTIR
jgi:subtilisin family serine protease